MKNFIRIIQKALIIAVVVVHNRSCLADIPKVSLGSTTETQRLIRFLSSQDWKEAKSRESIARLIEQLNAYDVPETKVLLLRFLDDPSATVKNLALDGLAKVKAPDAVVRIAKELDSKVTSVRIKAIWALSATGGKQAFQSITPLLSDPDAEVRQAAVYSVTSMQSSLDADLLIKVMRDKEVTPKLAILTASLKMKPADLARIVQVGITDASPLVRSRSILAGIQVSPPVISFETVENMTEDKEPLIRSAASRALGAFAKEKSPQVINLLLKKSHDTDAPVRQSVIAAASSLPVDEAIRVLKGLSKDPAPEVRWAVVQELGRSDVGGRRRSDAVPLLIVATQDLEFKVAEAAVLQLGELQAKEFSGVVLALYKRADKQTKVRSLIRLLGQIPENEARPLLIATLQDKDVDLRNGVMQSLFDFPPTLALELALTGAKDKESTVRLQSAQFLSRSNGNPKVSEALRQLSEDADINISQIAKQALTRSVPASLPTSPVPGLLNIPPAKQQQP